MEKLKGIILSITPYKEKSGIISILYKNKLIEATILNLNSENFSNLKKFSYGEFLLYKGPTKYFKLKSFYPIFELNKAYNDFTSLLVLDFLSEILIKILLIKNDYNENFFLLVFGTIKRIEDESSDKFYNLIFFYNKILVYLGLDPYNMISSYLANYKILSEFDYSIKISRNNFLKLFNIFSNILSNYSGIYLKSYNNIMLL